MKTVIFWKRKRTRTPKKIGEATADGSIYCIADMSRAAMRGDGKLYLVDCENAEDGRARIALHEGRPVGALVIGAAMKTVIHDGAIVALGVNACLAIAGTNDALKNPRVIHGGAKIKDTIALRPDRPMEEYLTPDNAFGSKLGR